MKKIRKKGKKTLLLLYFIPIRMDGWAFGGSSATFSNQGPFEKK